LAGGLNQYAYVNNSPVMSADPSGEVAPLLVLGAALFLFLASERAADLPAPGYQHCNVALEVLEYISKVTQLGAGGVLVPPAPPPGYARVGRWMSQGEYDAMVAEGRVQPTLEGLEAKSVTVPPDPDAFRAARPGSVFVEFDVPAEQLARGGTSRWGIVFGPNSLYGRLAASRGKPVSALPEVINIILRLRK
jgi:hypothetical protein